MTQNWQTTKEGNVAVCTLDRSEADTNILDRSVLTELESTIDNLKNDNSVDGVVFASAKKDFILGADIAQIAAFKSAEEATAGAKQLQAIFQKIADLGKITVASISGQCLGGGLELALACDWRVVSSDPKTKLALPEIQLGIIPGAGGTQRLPRLIGLQSALDMILSGRRIPGKKAEKIGLADACVPIQMLRDEAVKLASKKRKPNRKLPDLDPGKLSKDLPKWAAEGNPIGRRVMQKKAREMVDDKTKGFYPASYKALEAVFEGFDVALAKGLDLEAKLFGQLVITRESSSLVHLYNATTAVKKHPYRAAVKDRFGSEPVSMIGVIGAGLMGAGIATVCADRLFKVRISDPKKESVGRALQHARGYFQKKLDRRRMKTFEVDQRMAHISPGLNTIGFDDCDVVIEAVFEDLDLKHRILKDVEDQGGENFIFATNTSALPIQDIATAAKNPERVIGMHFFSPVEKMPLLEVVVTEKTADWVAGRTVELGQKLGKQVIIVKDGPGFYTTRALSFLLTEAAKLLTEGNGIEYIDKALTKFGFPVGPITLIDEVGIDVSLHVVETVGKAFPERMEVPDGLQPVVDSGRLGRKNRRGFYLYEDGKKGRPDSEIYKIIGTEKDGRNAPVDHIVDRCLLVFVNECVKCLEDGTLTSAYDGDVGAVFGLGFPPFWGGPFKYVDLVGAKTIVSRLKALEKNHGAAYQPSKLLLEKANQNELFFPDES